MINSSKRDLDGEKKVRLHRMWRRVSSKVHERLDLKRFSGLYLIVVSGSIVKLGEFCRLHNALYIRVGRFSEGSLYTDASLMVSDYGVHLQKYPRGHRTPLPFRYTPMPVAIPSYLCIRRVGTHEPIQVVHPRNRHTVESDQPVPRAQPTQGSRTLSLRVDDFDYRGRVLGLIPVKKGGIVQQQRGVVWLVGCISYGVPGGGGTHQPRTVVYCTVRR